MNLGPTIHDKDTTMAKDDQIIEALKKKMGYNAHQCCKNCKFFTGPDYGGGAVNHTNHCTLNPAISFPVEESGSCDHFTQREDKDTTP